VKVSRKYVDTYWEEEVMPYIDQMIEMKTNTDEESFDYNLDACGNYGGCSFLGKCSVGVKE
jgi:CTP:phosphocholine cytidylyltransferase-like protein